jgi:UDP-N-acetylglucosamine 4-epimerase
MSAKNESQILNQSAFLVTGGAGFIGSNLAEALVLRNVREVRVLDNLATGNISNIKHLIDQGKIKFVEGDIRDPEVCKNAVAGIDIVLHQAALGSVQRSINDPVTTNAVNIDGFLNMLDASKNEGVKRFIYASSSSVYGDDASMPKVEGKTGKLLSPYAVTKKTNEEYAQVFRELYGLNTIGLRYFNVFGPYQDVNGPYAAVIPLFIEAMISGVNTTIYGDGENTRDFTFVGNVVQANILAASSEIHGKKPSVFNIAYGGTTSLNTLHGILSGLMGNQLPPLYLPARKGDIKDSFADICSATETLGFVPAIGLKEGLKKTVEWFLKKHGKM